MKDLHNEQGNWDDNTIKEVFLPEDAKAIREIPRARLADGDEIIWNHDPKGIFLVKSAYHLAKNLSSRDNPSGSNNSKSKAIWKSIWKAKCSSRAKIVVWKIINNIIPTKINIINKGIDANNLCCLCRANQGTITHVFGHVSSLRRFG